MKMMNVTGKMLIVTGILYFTSCHKETSNVTGWAYNEPKNGGFEKVPYEEQETGPGLVLVEGGTFTMGRVEQDVMYDWNNVPRRVTVSSFYLDEVEISNFNYLEYLYWTRRVFGPNFTEVFKKALPDTLCWRNKLAFNEPYVEYYLRHPAYRDYPVVGVNWLQANDFCAWRTDRVNEFIMIREGIIDHAPTPSDQDYFNTDTYLQGKWTGVVKTPLPSLDPNVPERQVRMEDGILLPKYRLPTEAEWEYAAYSLIGTTIEERITERRLYPWSGHHVRNPDEKFLGDMLANYKRSNGDNMGAAGHLNDNADITAPVYSYWPNDYGLYNMAGNVSEWVMDVYRPLSPQDKADFRPFRGNVFRTYEKDIDGVIINTDSILYDKDSNISNIPGNIRWRDVSIAYKDDKLDERRNYKTADNISYLDGDIESSVFFTEGQDASARGDKLMYQTSGSNPTSMINDKARVYKGASWNDRAYYMNPGTRRFLDQRQTAPWLGFRCAMTRVGSPVGLGTR